MMTRFRKRTTEGQLAGVDRLSDPTVRPRRVQRSTASEPADGHRPPSTDGSRDPLVVLHRTVGNRTVQRLVDDGVRPPERNLGGGPNPAEREADRVADAVAPASVARPRAADSSGVESLRRTPTERGGRAVSRSVLSAFEPQLGYDFGSVQIHDDSRAASLSRAFSARAFTRGRDVYFGAGEYRPETASGRRLLAHELTHVVQQAGAGRPLVQRQPEPLSLRASLDPRSLSPDEVETEMRHIQQWLRDHPADPEAEHLESTLFMLRMHREVTERLSGRREAGTERERWRKALELRTFVREQLRDYPEKIRAYVAQPSPTPDVKSRVVGEVTAEVARMEFLTGTVAVEGSGASHTWETGGGNRGELVRAYREGTEWCAYFATTVRRVVTGRRLAGSGLRLAGRVTGYTPDYAGPGALFVGAGRHGSGRANPWSELTRNLREAETEAQRRQHVDQFYAEHGAPQAGDIMVVRRSVAPENRFTTSRTRNARGKLVGQGKSHTTMIERVDGHRVFTIEGNKANRVTGRMFDLTNPDHVREIILVSRESLPDAPAADGAGGEMVTGRTIRANDLLDPLAYINQLLRAYAAAEGYVRAPAGQADTVSESVHHRIPATDASGAR